MPTMKDVAARAGVAVSSVSRVLAGHANVRPEMRERVMAAVEAIGYKPDLVATALRKGSTRMVGVLVSDIRNPTLAAMVDALEVEFHRAGYGVLMSSSRGSSLRDIEGVEAFRQRRVDGLVVAAADDESGELIALLGGLAFPVVLMDRQAGDLPISRVLSDHYGGTRALMEHLADSGHSSVAVISGPSDSFPARERIRAAMDVAAERGMRATAIRDERVEASVRGGAASAADLLDSAEPPDALLVGNAVMLIGVLDELRRRGLVPGRDIAVTSGDDTFIATLPSPQITAMSRDLSAVGRESARQLLEHLGDPERMPHTIVLPTALVVRGSSS